MDKIKKIVYDYKTKYEQGFMKSEVEDVLNSFPNINKEKFYDALNGITCMIVDDNIITYHCDIEKALYCGVESRGLKSYEWD